MRMMKRCVEKWVFDEYIRCNLSDAVCKNGRNCNANNVTKNNNFKDCICVPFRIFDFTKRFFFLDEELYKCSCPIFGSDSENQKAGYTVYEALDLTGKSKSILDLFIAMGETPHYSNIMEVFAILLCAYLGAIINQSNIGLQYPTCSGFSTMIDEIYGAYSENADNSDILLCEIYFYICVCVRGSDTFKPCRLYSFFGGISRYSKATARKICDNLDEVVNEKKQGEFYIDILKKHPENYLACVCAFLELLCDKRNKLEVSCKFQPILEHFNTAFSNYKSTSPFEISNLMQELKHILKDN